MGPASGDANLASGYAWVRGLIVGAHPRLGVVTIHRYGLNACLPRGFPRYPTIRKLLSDSVEADVVRPVAAAVQYAHAAHLRFRLDEMNSVTCGGLPGVSNTFATALWAPDALFRMLQTGADGVNVHIRPDTINGPFVITTNGLSARPLLYGLILFARTLQGNGELVPLRMRPAGGPAGRLDAWAVQAGRHRLRVLLINKTKKPVNTVLRLHGADDASVERLAAYGARVTSGVTLDGQHLGPGAGWLGKKVVRRVALKAGQYDLVVPRYSAALLTVPTR